MANDDAIPPRLTVDAISAQGRPQQGGCNKTVDRTFLVTNLIRDHRSAIAESDLGPTRADRR